MTLMLAVVFLCVGVGLWSRRFGGREQWTIAGIATLMTALYYFTHRFMT